MTISAKLLCRFVAFAAVVALAPGVCAQTGSRIPGADRADLWSLKLGSHASEISVEAFTDYACGTNGGPPALALSGWGDYPKCRAEPGSGFHEVYFRYDDEAEYWTKAFNLTMQAVKVTGTNLYNQPVILSALFDDDGFLRGVRVVTDPRVPDDVRIFASSLRNFIFGRFSPEGWQCSDLPREPGEVPVSAGPAGYLKEHCFKSAGDIDVTLETRYFRRQGQNTLDRQTGLPLAGAFVSDARFDLVLNHDLPDRARRLADLQSRAVPTGELQRNRLKALDCPGCDLTGVNLKRQNLRGANLAGARLSDATLHGADLTGADLSGADLTNANLNKANLRQAKLAGATLTEAQLYAARLDGADLSRADLARARMGEAQLTRAKLAGAKVVDADLTRARLADSDLRGADFSGTWLAFAQMGRANLAGATLLQSDLTEAQLAGATLTGANLTGSDLLSANLRDADLSGADLSGTRLTTAILTGARTEGTKFKDALR